METGLKFLAYFSLILGLLMLFFTFYEAYSLFNTLINYASVSNSVNLSHNSNASNNSIAGISENFAIISEKISSIPINQSIFYSLAILLLFVFGSVSYKIALVGFNIIMIKEKNKENNKESSKNQPVNDNAVNSKMKKQI